MKNFLEVIQISHSFRYIYVLYTRRIILVTLRFSFSKFSAYTIHSCLSLGGQFLELRKGRIFMVSFICTFPEEIISTTHYFPSLLVYPQHFHQYRLCYVIVISVKLAIHWYVAITGRLQYINLCVICYPLTYHHQKLTAVTPTQKTVNRNC